MDTSESTLAPIGPLYGLPTHSLHPLDQLLPNQATRDVIDSRRIPLQLEFLALSALRNATLPFHRLPHEIMVDIFLMARDDTAYHPHDFRHPRRIGSSWHWVPLMRVCRHWWAVAWSTPQFWRTIDVYRNLEWLSLCLTRAAEATIEVSLHDESTALAAIPILLGVVDRLSTLLLPEIDESRFQPVLSLLHHRMPRIEGLGVARLYNPDLVDINPENARLDLSQTFFPSLKTLHLDGVAMPWSSTVLSRLTSLVIDECFWDSARIPLSTFLDVLESCQHLIKLTLQDVLRQILIDAQCPANDRVVSLSRLRKFTLIDTPEHLIQLLSCIDLPTNVAISITPILATFPVDMNLSFTAFLPADRRNIPILASADHVRLWSESDTGKLHIIARPPAHWQAGARGGDIYLNLDTEEVDDVFLTTWARLASSSMAGVVDLFGKSPLKSLRLMGHGFPAGVHDWVRLFAQFPTLERLSIDLSQPTESVATVLSALASALPEDVDKSDAGAADVVLPVLRKFSVMSGWCTEETMVQLDVFLRSRAERGAPPLEKLELYLHHDSHELFEARDAVAYDLLYDIMPNGASSFLVWDPVS